MNNAKYVLAFLAACVLMINITPSFSQTMPGETAHFRDRGYQIGVYGGANYNLSGLGYQQLDPQDPRNFVPLVYNDGHLFAPTFGIFATYLSNSWWGLSLRASYDDRSLTVFDNTLNPNERYDLHVNYITIEPLFRIDQHAIRNLHLDLGPFVAFNLRAKYDASNNVAPLTNVSNQTISNMNKVAWGLQGGLGYDINLSGENATNRAILTPFVGASWLVDQRPKSFSWANQDAIDDIWSTVSIKMGISLAFEKVYREAVVLNTEAPAPTMAVSLSAPAGGVVESRIYQEFFPLVNSIFFDKGSTDIPARYTRLSPDQAKSFTETSLIQPEAAKSEVQNMSDEQMPRRQMDVYYNILNIYGSRLRDNPNITVQLVGSSPDKDEDMSMLAGKVRDYLVNTYNIDPARVQVQTSAMPPDPSGTKATPKQDIPLVKEENRRVEFVFNDMNAIKPVQISAIDYSRVDNDLVFNINTREPISNWKVDISHNGQTFSYGPFYSDVQRIDPYLMIKDNKMDESGDYTAVVTANYADGRQLTEDKTFTLQKRQYKTDVIMSKRYSITFKYAQSDAIRPYEDFIRNTLAPNIQDGSQVVVYGHTDITGTPEFNQKLSDDRASEVKRIFDDQFKTLGRNVSVQAIGYGENDGHMVYDNNSPEGRNYNRNVVIEINPPGQGQK